jgi:hypothetical protein
MFVRERNPRLRSSRVSIRCYHLVEYLGQFMRSYVGNFLFSMLRTHQLCQSTQNQSKSICNQHQGDATTRREAGAHRKSPPPTKPSPSPTTASRNLASVAIARRPCGSSRAGLPSRLRTDDTRRHSQLSSCRREAHAPHLNKAPRVGFTQECNLGGMERMDTGRGASRRGSRSPQG